MGKRSKGDSKINYYLILSSDLTAMYLKHPLGRYGLMYSYKKQLDISKPLDRRGLYPYRVFTCSLQLAMALILFRISERDLFKEIVYISGVKIDQQSFTRVKHVLSYVSHKYHDIYDMIHNSGGIKCRCPGSRRDSLQPVWHSMNTLRMSRSSFGKGSFGGNIL